MAHKATDQEVDDLIIRFINNYKEVFDVLSYEDERSIHAFVSGMHITCSAMQQMVLCGKDDPTTAKKNVDHFIARVAVMYDKIVKYGH